MNKELALKMEKLQPLVEKYNRTEDAIRYGEDGYIRTHCQKPTKRDVPDEKRPTRPSSPSAKGFIPIFISGAVLLLFIVITINTFIKSGTEGFGFGLMTLCVFLAIPVVISAKRIYDDWDLYKYHLRKYEGELEEYNKRLATNQKDIDYNEKEYPRLMKAYDESVERAKREYRELEAKTKKELASLSEEIEGLDVGLSHKYYSGIYFIAKYIRDGEAESLSEAVQLYNQSMRELDEELERKAREEREEEFRREMRDREIERDMEERSRRDKERREAQRREYEEKLAAKDRCRNCIHRPNCRAYGTVNCASYSPQKSHYFG